MQTLYLLQVFSTHVINCAYTDAAVALLAHRSQLMLDSEQVVCLVIQDEFLRIAFCSVSSAVYKDEDSLLIQAIVVQDPRLLSIKRLLELFCIDILVLKYLLFLNPELPCYLKRIIFVLHRLRNVNEATASFNLSQLIILVLVDY